MSSKNGNNGRVANWSTETDRTLLDFLVDHKVSDDGFANGNFTKEAWRSTVVKFNENTKLGYSLQNLKNRFKNLKKLYSLYVNLKNRSGWGWDDDKQIPAPGADETWEDLMACNKEYKQIQGRPFYFMEQMHIIWSTSMATGNIAASNAGQSYLDLMSEIADEGDEDIDIDIGLDLNAINIDNDPPEINGISIDSGTPDINGINIDSDTPEINLSTNLPSSNGTSQTTSNGARKRKRDVQTNNDAFDRLVMLGEERLTIWKEMLQQQKEATPPSVEAAIHVMMNVEGIPDQCIYKALDLLKPPEDRSIFLSMPANLRLGWVMSRLGYI